jgi:cation:H+ antiporter
MIRPRSFNLAFNTDIYLVAAGTFLLFAAMFLGGKRRLDRWEAVILLVIFIGYTIYLVQKEV